MVKDSETYTLYYWTRAEGVVGRTHGVLMCLEEAGVKYVVKDNTQMPSGTHCMAVPVVTLPDGSQISQQSAICAAIGMVGSTVQSTYHLQCRHGISGRRKYLNH